MELKEIRAAKVKLEAAVNEALREFSATTDLVVEHISVNQAYAFGDKVPVYHVTTEVKI